MKTNALILTAAIMVFSCIAANAHDFVVSIDGQKVYFNIKSKTAKTAELTYNGSIADAQPTNYKGELTVPSKVQHEKVIYTVAGISAKAFSGANKMTGIILPSEISYIGDFAFEGCTALGKIVFPGRTIQFGQGVFFKCDKIQTISLGSDWKEVDLKMFRWSDSLRTLTIPAKVEKIMNMKYLKALESVSVDRNNTKFTATDGLLYNKSQDVLYGCPRAYSGKIRIYPGTKKITTGALADCKYVTRVDIPESMESLSFREFSRMDSLKEIIFRGRQPLMTAKSDEKEVFLLQVSSPTVKIIVSKEARKAYKSALINKAGEYTEIGGQTPYLIEQDRMPKVKNIIGVTSFKNYE